MAGKKNKLTPLEVRMQMLLVESNLNRVQLEREWRGLQGEIHRLTGHFKTVGSLTMAATKAGTMISIWRRFFGRSSSQHAKLSWLSSLLDGIKAGTSLWMALRS